MSGLAVQTVLGTLEPERLGVTSTHEHLLIDLVDAAFFEPEEASQRAHCDEPITLSNLGWVRRNWASSRENLRLLDEQLAADELQSFRLAGGTSIVDATTRGIGRDPEALARISRASGVAIVMGCGYYTCRSHPPELATSSEGAITDEILADLRDGVGTTKIKSGIIGEIGCSYPLTEDEAKVLRAAGRAQAASGAALMIHPGRNPAAPMQILHLLDEVGAALDRVVIAHIDRTVTSRDGLTELLKTGCYLEFDLFGLETSYYPLAPDLAILSDAQRVARIEWIAEQGHIDRVVVAHDVCTKHRLRAYGGHGYDHLLTSIVPMLRQRPGGEELIDSIMLKNPRQLLTFNPEPAIA